MYWIALFIGLVAIALAWVTTPVVKAIALRMKCTDKPSSRKVHTQPIVRLGGVAICGATLGSFVPLGLLNLGLLNLRWLNDWSSMHLPLAGVGGSGWGLSHLDLSSLDLSHLDLSSLDLSNLDSLNLDSSSLVFSGLLPLLAPLLLGGFGFFLVGFCDDLLDLSALKRLGLQCAIASAVWGVGIRIESLSWPGFEPWILGWLSLPITVLWLTGVVNAINWMDGLDGLAAGIAGIASLLLVILGWIDGQVTLVLLGAALLGSLLGFLYYNSNPAQIFMGDGGSYFLGFSLAALCVIGPFHGPSSLSSVIALGVLAVPLVDMTAVILTRLCDRKSPFQADQRHLHHRLLQLGLSHRRTVWVIYGLAGLSSSVVLIVVGFTHPSFWAGLTTSLPAIDSSVMLNLPLDFMVKSGTRGFKLGLFLGFAGLGVLGLVLLLGWLVRVLFYGWLSPVFQSGLKVEDVLKSESSEV